MLSNHNLIGHRLTIALTSIAFGLLFDVNRVHAQSATAESLFADGNKLMDRGEFVEACAAFEASNRVEPRAGTLLRLGDCREKNQQLASAWSAYKDARSLATDPRKRQYATVKITALGKQLSYLTVIVSGQIQILDLALTRNGVSFEPALWNRALPVDGGDYVITVRAPGYDTWETTVHVPMADAKLSVDMQMLTKTRPHPLAPPQTSRTVVPLIVGAGALTLLGGGLGFELWAESRYGAAHAEMASQQRRDSLYNSANTNRHAAEALATGGLAAATAAVWLYLRAGSRERSPASTSIHIVPIEAGIALLGQF
ncbi:MAG TPA: hypothetical protein VHT91_33865 [Kofleriaceae bacterium]|jgi:hypothetical protein|nr:hypothetical protein [Kofleriaceae bacterium]